MKVNQKRKHLSRGFRVAGLVLAFSVPFQGYAAEKVSNKPDGSWISLSGKVVSHQPKSFTLDYGEGIVKVETDDWDNNGDGWGILEGDEVTVYGKVDNDLFEQAKIEADSIYIDDLSSLLTAPSPADEETPDRVSYVYFSRPADTDLQLTGTVTSVKGREFTLDTGPRKVTVDTITMGYNPLDEHGFQKVEVGDFVSVAGDLRKTFFGGRELDADTVVSYN